MRLTATDIVSLYRPTPCPLRVYLREQGAPEAEPSAFDQILRTLGQRHELDHLASLGDYENLSVVPPDERIEQTAAAIRNRVPVLYQGEFSCKTALLGIPVTIVGRPDFLMLDGDGYIIRDSKLSRKVDDEHHEEITLQLQLYGWLFEQTVGTPAKRLEVYTGKCDIVNVPYDGGVAALAELARIFAIKRLNAEPYEPVGWSKCGSGCGYYDHCWQQAEAKQDVSLVMEVDQGLARKLHEGGIAQITEQSGQLLQFPSAALPAAFAARPLRQTFLFSEPQIRSPSPIRPYPAPMSADQRFRHPLSSTPRILLVHPYAQE